IFLVIIFVIFIFIFFDYESEFLGGGVIKKSFFLIFGDNLIYKIFLISSAFLGLLFYLQLSIFKDLKLLLFSPYFILLTLTDYVFQEYFDPIFLIFVLFYTNLFNIKNISNLYKFIAYFSILLISANIYYLS
ncbi:hypothetical protein N9U97_00750, partial [Candidatus Pelagibacter sp.]